MQSCHPQRIIVSTRLGLQNAQNVKIWLSYGLFRLLGTDMKTEQLIELTSGKLNSPTAMHNLMQQMEKKDVRYRSQALDQTTRTLNG